MSAFFTRTRWAIGAVMVGGGTIAASWGAFDAAQMSECGTETTAACSLDVMAPILALAGGFTVALIGAIFGRSGRLLMAFFGLALAGGATAVYLSLNGPNADPTADPTAALATGLPAGLAAFGALFLVMSARKTPPGFNTSSSSGSSWGDSGGWDGDSGSSGCSSGCGGGCGGGGD